VGQAEDSAHCGGLLRFARNDKRSGGASLVKKIINLSLVAILGLVAIGKLYLVTHPALVGHYLVEGYPARAAAWLEENYPEGGRMLNEYNWGGYIQWALPAFPTFVDGRTDLFGDKIVGDWIVAIQAGPGWEDVFRRYPADLIMLQPDRPLLKKLSEQGWKLLYEDSHAVIYGK